MDRVWTSYFNALFAVTEEAIESRKIPLDDLRQQEPYIFFGLTGATVLRCVVNSLKEPQGIRLAVGLTMLPESCPVEHKEMLNIMLALKQRIPRDIEYQWLLEQMILYGNSEHKVVTRIQETYIPGLKQIAAQIQAVSIHITQQHFFQSQFQSMLELILSLYREI